MASIGALFAGADRIINETGGDTVAPYIGMGSNDPKDREILARYEFYRTRVYSQYLADCASDERFYRQEFAADIIPEAWKSKGFTPTVPPTAYNAVESASNHILTTPDMLIPERPSENDVLREQQIAELKRAALVFFWHQAFKQGDPLGHAKKDLIKYGRIVLKKYIDYDAMPEDGTVIGRGKFPWCVKQLAPTQVFEDPARPYDPAHVYEVYETTKADAIRMFPTARGEWRKAKRDHEAVRVLEYWERPAGTSKGRRVIFIEDEKVLDKVNPYHWAALAKANGSVEYDGYVPYFIADSGWGDGDVNAKPHERFVGLIRRIHSLLMTETRQLTAADAQLRVSTFPIIKMTGIEEDDEKPIKFAPGEKVYLQTDQDISTVEWPKLDPALFAIVSRVHSYVNELVQFQTLSGAPQPGVDSATEADQNYRAASAKLNGPIKALSSVISRINETVFMDVENVLEDEITLYGAVDGAAGAVVLKPEYIEGFYENYVELKTSDQKQADGANAMRWAQLMQVFNLDSEYAMKQAGIASPRQRRARRADEDVFNDPRMHEMRVALAMQEMGGELGQLAARAVIDNLITGVPVDPKAGGSVPAPPMGEPSARNENPTLDPAGSIQPPQQNPMRAAGFGKAMMQRPDLQYGAA